MTSAKRPPHDDASRRRPGRGGWCARCATAAAARPRPLRRRGRTRTCRPRHVSPATAGTRGRAEGRPRGRHGVSDARAPLSRQRLQRRRAVAGGTAGARRVRAIRRSARSRQPASACFSGLPPTTRRASSSKRVPETLTLSSGARVVRSPSGRRPRCRRHRLPAAYQSRSASRDDQEREANRPARRRPRRHRARRRSAVSRRAHRRSRSRVSSISRPPQPAPLARRPDAAVRERLRHRPSGPRRHAARTARRASCSTRAACRTYSIYALYKPYRLVIDCVRGPRPAPPPLPIRRPELHGRVGHASCRGGCRVRRR